MSAMPHPITRPVTHVLIDAGNTRIKCAVLDASKQGFTYVGHCATHASVDEIAALLQQAQQTCQLSTTVSSIGKDYTLHIHGVCVAGEAVKQTITHAAQSLPLQSIQWRTGLSILPRLRNDYATPATLGADRWLAAYGVSQWVQAHSNTPAPVAVLATFGTATTVDVVRWDALHSTYAFVGGIILAGLNTALSSVSYSTAQLPDMQAALAQLSQSSASGAILVPSCTADALLLGAVLAQVGAVHQVMALAEQHFGAAQCFIAGGAVPVMQSYLTRSQVLEHPVFIGLAHLIHADTA